MAAKSPGLEINLWPKQAMAMSSPATEILYGGSAGGGKSYLMRAVSILWALEIPGIQIYLFRRQYMDLEKNHLEGPTSYHRMLEEYTTRKKVEFNSQKFRFLFWNHSAIFLCHCFKEEDKFNYLGAEIHALLIDELAQFTPSIYSFLRTRVRMVGVKLPPKYAGMFPRILCSSNPGGPAGAFMRENWVDVRPEMEIWRAPREDGGMLRQFIPAKLKDNPSLYDADPDYELRLRAVGDEGMAAALADGDFTAVPNGVFSDVWKKDKHVIQPFRIPSSWYLDRALDWGTSKPFAVGWFAESDGTEAVMADGTTRTFARGTIFQIGEWYGTTGKGDQGIRLTPEEVRDGIIAREAESRLHFNRGPADSQIWENESHGVSVVTTMALKGLHWNKADKRPGSRKVGVEQIRKRLKAGLDGAKEEPGLFFFSNCLHQIRLLPSAPRDDVQVEDVHKRYEDHTIDMLRYRVTRGRMRLTESKVRIL